MTTTALALPVSFIGPPAPTDSWHQMQLIGQIAFAVAVLWVVVIAVRLVWAQWGSGSGPTAEEAVVTGCLVAFGATVAWVAGGLS